MPSFGFGGTFKTRNSRPASSGRLHAVSTECQHAVREADPLRIRPNSACALSGARSSLSYLAKRWMRVEGFFVVTFQDSRRPGGRGQSIARRHSSRRLYTHEDPLMEERSTAPVRLPRRTSIGARWWLITPIAIGHSRRHRTGPDATAAIQVVHDAGGDVAEHDVRTW